MNNNLRAINCTAVSPSVGLLFTCVDFGVPGVPDFLTALLSGSSVSYMGLLITVPTLFWRVDN